MNKILFCMILAFITSSCSYYNSHQEQVKCHHMCQSKLRHCLAICHNSQKDCSVAAYESASYQHQKYKNEQINQGKDIILELKSFRDPLQCQKTTCECLSDVRVCRQFCEGKIRKRLQVVPPPC